MSDASKRSALSDAIDQELHRRHAVPAPPLAYVETGRQVYAGNGATFSAGVLRNHPVDTIYLTLERDGEPWTLHLRSDEALTIIWLLSGALWSERMGDLIENETTVGED